MSTPGQSDCCRTTGRIFNVFVHRILVQDAIILRRLQSRRSASKHLQTGDIFLTKHSNLAAVHIVFHMIVDDGLRSSECVGTVTVRRPLSIFNAKLSIYRRNKFPASGNFGSEKYFENRLLE